MGKPANNSGRVTSYKFEDGEIRRARQALGLKLEFVAEESGVSLASLKRVENNNLPINTLSASKLTKFFLTLGIIVNGPKEITLADTIELVLSGASPRRGHLCSNLEFTLESGNADVCLVKETTYYPIMDEDSAFFTFGANPDEIVEMRSLSFFVSTGPKEPKRTHVRIGGGPEPLPAQLLSLVTGKIGKVGQETQLGVREKVPDSLLKKGHFMITEAEYVVPLTRLFSWKVANVTEGFDLEIGYPKTALLPEVETFVWEKPSYSESRMPEKHEMFQLCYRSGKTLLPESGLVWRFRRLPMNHA